MMKLSEFARNYGVSERHARRLLQKHEADLVGHYEKRGNEGTFVDDVGAEYLKSKLRASFDVVIEEPSDRERQLERTLTELSLRYADAMAQIAKNAGAVALLEAANDRADMLEAKAGEAEERARAAEQKAEESERLAVSAVQKKLDAELALEESRERAETAEDIAELNAQEAARARAEAEDLKIKLERIAAARGFKRRKLIKELKKKE